MSIAENLRQIEQQIEDATHKAGRAVNSVTLLAVSKAQKINKIEEAFKAGQKLFGESYLSEAIPKIASLKEYPIEWHFIGPIQSNKTKEIASHFAWVQSVDRIKIARRLSEQRPENLGALNITAQINMFDESTKQGASITEIYDLLDFINQQPNLNLKGLMSIPPKQSSEAAQKQQFHKLQELFHRIKSTYSGVDTLSMGMSGDMISAIEEGSTMVRVGTALFGARPENWKQQLKGNS
ncbi:YggS family pyridoxal phosphate-dependent enzyme [Pleionea sediminis]|uniref:YggS family pyridoxal phosphate-dependent enzyme n=1 Tax=Pleionea sediminis TaxID=2569479 RepID=UPI0011855C49|nr:YggS family pyridoxal phosphate-dependent enzyme [Pleionea sediminis]